MKYTALSHQTVSINTDFIQLLFLLKYRNKDELILALKKNGRPEKELSKNKTGHIKKVWQSIGNKKKKKI